MRLCCSYQGVHAQLVPGSSVTLEEHEFLTFIALSVTEEKTSGGDKRDCHGTTFSKIPFAGQSADLLLH